MGHKSELGLLFSSSVFLTLATRLPLGFTVLQPAPRYVGKLIKLKLILWGKKIIFKPEAAKEYIFCAQKDESDPSMLICGLE